ncbi:MAG: hypothetical protein AAF456_07505 [Planctomycetota bacterium]
MITKSCISLVAVSLLFVPAIPGDAVHELSGIKCVVDGEQNANQLWTAPWREGEVYLSSHHCIDKFVRDSSAFEMKANHQLVLTGQYTQEACPCCGDEIDINDDVVLPVAGLQIHFASSQCRDRIANRESVNGRVEAIYADRPFETAFKSVYGR